MKEAERQRKAQGKGIVRQAKIVFEGREGGKVNEKSGAGRSRGYGFIEYATHRSALMGLRWLNGHAVKSTDAASKEERQKRLIVEFAIENAQVVARRKELEEKAKNGEVKQGRFAVKPKMDGDRPEQGRVDHAGRKRKRSGSETKPGVSLAATKGRNDFKRQGGKGEKKNVASMPEAAPPREVDEGEKNKIAKRNRIISKKRMMRKKRAGK